MENTNSPVEDNERRNTDASTDNELGEDNMSDEDVPTDEDVERVLNDIERGIEDLRDRLEGISETQQYMSTILEQNRIIHEVFTRFFSLEETQGHPSNFVLSPLGTIDVLHFSDFLMVLDMMITEGLDESEEFEDVPVPLKEELLNKIPIEQFTLGSKFTQCSVCLSDFEMDDNIRVLPCTHIFHPICIDKWFTEHTGCPLCRIDMRDILEK